MQGTRRLSKAVRMKEKMKGVEGRMKMKGLISESSRIRGRKNEKNADKEVNVDERSRGKDEYEKVDIRK